VQLIIWSLVAAGGCGSDQGPAPLPNCTAALASKVSLVAGRDTSIDATVGAGCATFPANASTINPAEYLIVAQAATSATDTSASFVLSSATLTAARVAAQRVTPPSPALTTTATAFDHLMRQLGQRGQASAPAAAGRPPAAAAVAPAATPPRVGSQRTFAVCSNLNCTTSKAVTATAVAVGLHVAIYVDTMAPKPGLSAADVDTLRQVFDTLLYPLDSTTFGAASDLDNNGVVISLMTPVVNALVPAPCAGGYLAGFFFPPDLAPVGGLPSNGGEIFYSIVADPLGTLSCAHSATNVKQVTPTVFAHEFQHMINFVQHGIFRTGSGEEGWLDEGLSKYAEELVARKYLSAGDAATFHQDLDRNNLYDASQYLSGPGSATLLIRQDAGTLAEIGASWLFVRYVMDQYGGAVNAYGGAALAGKLDQTAFTGATNVQTQTGQSFTTLLERWALANWVSDLPNFTAPPQLQYTSWHFRATFDSLHMKYPSAFPATYPLVPDSAAGSQVSRSGVLHAGSGVYVRALQAANAAAFTLQLSGPGVLLPPYIGPRYQVIRIR
jgi:hypothetical protein